MMHRRLRLLTALAVIAAAAPSAPAQARAAGKAPTLTKIRCVPATKIGCETRVRVQVGQKIQLSGKHLVRGMRVSFRWSRGALASSLAKDKTGWTTRVPTGTTVGAVSVTVTDRKGRRSKPKRIVILAPPKVSTPVARPDESLPAIFTGNGMWIWQLDKSDGGDLDAIAARAKAAGIGTVFVKSADGTTAWSQFDADLVAGLHARGLKVCAWQYVYGSQPATEAAAAALAIAAGADCFVIDAETEYEHLGTRYAAATKYLAALRTAVGAAFPIGFTSYPFVDFHPKVPYSVFLGPGGAQANLPQAYWEDIGYTVDATSAKTVATNRVYGTPIAPLGQLYGNPTPPDAADVRRFRALWAGYGARGLSWWSWQAASASLWAVLGETALPSIIAPDPGWPGLGKGSSGDLVVALQERLATFDPTLTIDGDFGAGTVTVLKAFQASVGLTATGEADAATWQALLKLNITPGTWD